MKKFIFFIPFLFLTALCLWAILPLFHPGFFPMHDDEQIARLFEMKKVLGDLQIPPRWVPDLGFGFGFPVFNFYPPLVYYLGVIFVTLGFSYIVSTKIVMALGFILAAYFMYLWVKNRFGMLAGFVAAFLYTYAPYHAVDLYVRGAFSEFFSFVFIPASFWALDKLATTKKGMYVILSGVFLACVMLTHNLVALQAIPFFVIYGLYLLYQERAFLKKVFLLQIIASVIALCLSSYFWLPAILEKQYTLVDSILTKELASYFLHFVCPIQLWSSPWGYGGSVAGCVDGLSFQVGKVHIILAILAFVLFIFQIFVQKKRKHMVFVFLIIFLAMFSAFMTTQYSDIVWKHISALWYLQFPWRYLLFAAVFTSVLGGYVVSVVYKKYKITAVLIALFVCLLAFLQIRSHFQPSKYELLGDDHYTQHNDIQWRVSSMSFEYVPKGVATVKSSINTTQLAIKESDIPTETYSVVSGTMGVRSLVQKSQEKSYSVSVTKPGILQINTYSFPGWMVIVDGKQIRYNDNNKLKLIQTVLPIGKHIVEVKFTNTRVRSIGNVISLITVIALLIYSGFACTRKKI